MTFGGQAVLRTCEAALASAVEGRGRLLVLSGEAGIGKTTVARAVVDRAPEEAIVRWGGCWEGDSPPPLGVWFDVLRRPGGDECASVIEQLERDALDADVDGLVSARARARFFAALIDAVQNCSTRSLQLMVLEDLQWSDTGSLDLLGAMAVRLPTTRALVMATYRTDEGLDEQFLASLGGTVDHVELAGIDRDGVGEILSDLLGYRPDESEITSLHQRTGGNSLSRCSSRERWRRVDSVPRRDEDASTFLGRCARTRRRGARRGSTIALRPAGELADWLGSVGFCDIVEPRLEVTSTYADFDELWSGFLHGIGPTVAFCVSLPTLTASAHGAVGRLPA